MESESLNYNFISRKLYYKYIDTSTVNHFRLLLLTEEFIKIGKKYFLKYPNARCHINLNEELFHLNKQAEIDYLHSYKKQSKIQNEFFQKRDILCKDNKNKDCIICSDYFQKFYQEEKYHYGQLTEQVIKDIKTDIINFKKQ